MGPLRVSCTVNIEKGCTRQGRGSKKRRRQGGRDHGSKLRLLIEAG